MLEAEIRSLQRRLVRRDNEILKQERELHKLRVSRASQPAIECRARHLHKGSLGWSSGATRKHKTHYYLPASLPACLPDCIHNNVIRYPEFTS